MLWTLYLLPDVSASVSCYYVYLQEPDITEERDHNDTMSVPISIYEDRSASRWAGRRTI